MKPRMLLAELVLLVTILNFLAAQRTRSLGLLSTRTQQFFNAERFY
jgi:hypothetical protein